MSSLDRLRDVRQFEQDVSSLPRMRTTRARHRPSCRARRAASRGDGRARALAGAVWERCVGSRVTRLHRLLALRYDQALAEVGLTLPQVEMLSAFTMRGRAVGPSEMGQNLLVGRSAMSRKLAALEDRGWIETTERSATGRSMLFTITPAGTAQLSLADQAWQRVQDDVEARIGEQAARQIDRWLATLQEDR